MGPGRTKDEARQDIDDWLTHSANSERRLASVAVRWEGAAPAFPGKADYLIAGYFAGLAEASKAGVKDQVEPLSPAILEAEMFVAFSKKSPCRSLAPKFSEGITAMTTDGRFDKILEDATTAWDAAQQPKK